MFSLIISVFDSVDVEETLQADNDSIVFGFLSYDIEEDDDDIDNSVIISHFQITSNIVYTISPIFSYDHNKISKEEFKLSRNEPYQKNLLVREDIKPPIS